MSHTGKSVWHDRHARDPLLDPEKVRQRRTGWVEAQLREGDGFVVGVLGVNEDLGSYVVVPVDRSRKGFGGPVVAGLNAVAGSIYEGRGLARAAILEAFRRSKSICDAVVIQFQPENIPMARMVTRAFLFRSCTRYDIHWHDS